MSITVEKTRSGIELAESILVERFGMKDKAGTTHVLTHVLPYQLDAARKELLSHGITEAEGLAAVELLGAWNDADRVENVFGAKKAGTFTAGVKSAARDMVLAALLPRTLELPDPPPAATALPAQGAAKDEASTPSKQKPRAALSVVCPAFEPGENRATRERLLGKNSSMQTVRELQGALNRADEARGRPLSLGPTGTNQDGEDCLAGPLTEAAAKNQGLSTPEKARDFIRASRPETH